MDCALKYNFTAAEREAYQKSTHCQNVTNHFFITRYFMIQVNTLQSTGYQPLRQYICLQTTVRGASTHSRSIHFHRVIAPSVHKSFSNMVAIHTHTHTHQSQRIAQAHNTNHTFACTQLSRSLAEVQT